MKFYLNPIIVRAERAIEILRVLSLRETGFDIEELYANLHHPGPRPTGNDRSYARDDVFLEAMEFLRVHSCIYYESASPHGSVRVTITPSGREFVGVDHPVDDADARELKKRG